MPTILQHRLSVDSSRAALKGEPKSEQSISSEHVNAAGGVGFMARDLRVVQRELNLLEGKK
jgi:hypothetical protein